jgi:hypothetical protein
VKSSKEIEEEVRNNKGGGVFPSTDSVSKNIIEGGGAPSTVVQSVQGGESHTSDKGNGEHCRDYTTVLTGSPPSFSASDDTAAGSEKPKKSPNPDLRKRTKAQTAQDGAVQSVQDSYSDDHIDYIDYVDDEPPTPEPEPRGWERE